MVCIVILVYTYILLLIFIYTHQLSVKNSYVYTCILAYTWLFIYPIYAKKKIYCLIEIKTRAARFVIYIYLN